MLPPSLLNVVNRLEGFSTNIFRLEANSRSSGLKAQDIIQFELPANSIINLRSFKIFFEAALTGPPDTATFDGTADSSEKYKPRLPANVNCLMERIEVTAGGVQLSQGNNFVNVLIAARDAVMGMRADATTGHPEIELAEQYGFALPTAVADSTTMTYPAGQYFAFDTFPGFLESAPFLLDTSLLPDITVRITLAPNAVCGVLPWKTAPSTGDAAAGTSNEVTNAATFVTACSLSYPVYDASALTYTLNNVHAMIESVSFANSLYTQMLASQMAAEGFLELPFTSYQQTTSVHTGATRFTVAAQSLDRIWMAWRVASHANAPRIHIVPGRDAQLDLAQTKACVKAVTNYFNFSAPCDSYADVGKIQTQLQLNGTLYPQFYANPIEWAALTKNALPRYNHDLIPAQLAYPYYVQVSRHNLPCSDRCTSNISGIDTRAVNLQGVVQTLNANPTQPTELFIFMECTSTLRVGPARSIVPIP